jgi:predicted ATPase
MEAGDTVMAVGLCGAHRAGKSTLARTFAERAGIPFIATKTSQVFELLGMDPAAEYPIVTRIALQQAILHALVRQLEAANRAGPVFVADRTPIDLASYLLADVGRATLQDSPELARMVTSYVTECVRETTRFFSVVLHVPPGIPFIAEEGKAGPCSAYQEHLTALQLGLLNQSALKWAAVPRGMLDLNARIDYLERSLATANISNEADIVRREELGVALH